MAFTWVIIFALCAVASVKAQNELVVETALGKIQGTILKTAKGQDINAFRGIRYAQAPVLDKRFKEPLPVAKWDTTFDATEDGPLCPQPGVDRSLISENCLILNIYSRNLTGSSPVVVYIHGGSYVSGGSHSEKNSGPQYLLDADVVLVTMNYRLGALGFLTTHTKDAPGNYGFLDQVMALKWVRDHISKFGGNPSSVTLIGHSAGATSVTLHMSSPKSAGLFHKAIVMSASGTNHHIKKNLFLTRQLARFTGCPMYNPPDVVQCLRHVPWQDFNQFTSAWYAYGFPQHLWDFEVDGSFLPLTPTAAFATGAFNEVPILTGITKDECSFDVLVQEGDVGFFNDISLSFDKYSPEFFKFDPKTTPEAPHKIKNFYLGNKTINQQNLTNFGDIFSDSLLIHGVHRLVELARRYVDVYYYRFDYVGRYGKWADRQGKPMGVSHGDDLQYILRGKWFDGYIQVNDSDWFMVERLVGVIENFAHTGSPGKINALEWVPSNKTHVVTMFNNKDVQYGSEPYTERMKLWDDLFPVHSGESSVRSLARVVMLAILGFHIWM